MSQAFGPPPELGAVSVAFVPLVHQHMLTTKSGARLHHGRRLHPTIRGGVGCPLEWPNSASTGKLADHGHGIGGYCLICRRLFDVSLQVLILERGRDSSCIGMAPLRCPGCEGRRTQYTIVAPSKA
jgi:hypothetical protein